MRILALGYSDTAGSPGRWARALAGLGHEVTLLLEAPHPFKYAPPGGVPVEMVRWSDTDRARARHERRIAEKARGNDVVLAFDHPFYRDSALGFGVPTHFHAFGTAGHEIKASAGATGDTIELCTSGYEWLPMPVYADDYPPLRPSHDPYVFHAPTAPKLKGTRLVVGACEIAGIPLERPAKIMSHADTLTLKAGAAIVVCQVYDGTNPRVNAYGVTGLEAFAMGIPVVGSPSPQVEPHHERLLDERPYRNVPEPTADALAGELLLALADRESLVAAGHRYIAAHHDPTTCALKMVERLTAAIDRGVR